MRSGALRVYAEGLRLELSAGGTQISQKILNSRDIFAFPAERYRALCLPKGSNWVFSLRFPRVFASLGESSYPDLNLINLLLEVTNRNLGK